jgi:hypothetical protein
MFPPPFLRPFCDNPSIFLTYSFNIPIGIDGPTPEWTFYAILFTKTAGKSGGFRLYNNAWTRALQAEVETQIRK